MRFFRHVYWLLRISLARALGFASHHVNRRNAALLEVTARIVELSSEEARATVMKDANAMLAKAQETWTKLTK